MNPMLISPNISDLFKSNIEIKAFPDGENYLRIPDIANYSDKKVVVLHRLYPEQDRHIMQAILILDILKRVGAKPILICPYLPYSRQDKTFLEGEAHSAEALCEVLKNAGAEKLITLDCHFLKKEGSAEYGGLKIENMSMGKSLVDHAKKSLGGEEIEVISPDAGASYLVEEYGGKSMKKVRGEYVEGSKETYRKIEKLERGFEVSGKNIMILDDMIASGGTMLRAVENVKKGGAKKVICAATHGFFLKGSLEKLEESCDHVFVTNSIQSPVSEVDFLEVLKERGMLQ